MQFLECTHCSLYLWNLVRHPKQHIFDVCRNSDMPIIVEGACDCRSHIIYCVRVTSGPDIALLWVVSFDRTLCCRRSTTQLCVWATADSSASDIEFSISQADPGRPNSRCLRVSTSWFQILHSADHLLRQQLATVGFVGYWCTPALKHGFKQMHNWMRACRLECQPDHDCKCPTSSSPFFSLSSTEASFMYHVCCANHAVFNACISKWFVHVCQFTMFLPGNLKLALKPAWWRFGCPSKNLDLWTRNILFLNTCQHVNIFFVEMITLS